ncbi:purine-nucleoside phosphorylase [Fretibacter rubidus]|uniref:purine-nucleoside phosphorylase n=1 Tax=Fretibacter rubidus TaxID=570162 RepID=UPI00352A9B7E
MTDTTYAARIDTALASIRKVTSDTADVGLVLGSGLGDVAESVEGTAIDYSAIDSFPRATAPTHKGIMHIGSWQGARVCALQGRFHLYEGHSPADIGFPIDVMHALGVKTLIVTNITGSLNPALKTGDIVGINDHIFLSAMVGHSPLVGREQTQTRSTFVPMSRVYDADLLTLADTAHGSPLPRAVYGCVGGPQFETPAEGRMLRALGADIVGMSSLYEVVMARYYGMRVLGLSLVVNPVITDPDNQSDISEAEIWKTVQDGQPRMSALLHSIIAGLV